MHSNEAVGPHWELHHLAEPILAPSSRVASPPETDRPFVYERRISFFVLEGGGGVSHLKVIWMTESYPQMIGERRAASNVSISSGLRFSESPTLYHVCFPIKVLGMA